MAKQSFDDSIENLENTIGLKGLLDINSLVDFFSLILDNVYSGIIVCDLDCRIVFMNKVYGELLNTDPKAAVGTSIRKHFPHTRLSQVMSTGRSELGQKCSLQTEMPILVNRIPLKIKGHVVGVILQTIFRDYQAMTDLMSRLKTLENQLNYFKKGLNRVLSPIYTFDCIIGRSKALQAVKNIASKYAQTEAPILVIGPTGTGKEMFSHALHGASPRASGPFVCVNCAAIPRELLEMELFGYEAGAFTGADRKGKVGKIQLAHMGTLFLDEIGELSVKAQVKLLRVLEYKMLDRVGGVKPISVDFRLITATNRDLKLMMSRGDFRADLYYRLSTMSIVIPLLKARTGDIELLVRHFLKDLGLSHMRVTPEAMNALTTYNWPGNVRELKNVIERAGSLAGENIIGLDQLTTEVLQMGCSREHLYEESDSFLVDEMARFEKTILERTLLLYKGNMSKSSKKLGISRSTLYEKCRRHDLLSSSPKT